MRDEPYHVDGDRQPSSRRRLETRTRHRAHQFFNALRIVDIGGAKRRVAAVAEQLEVGDGAFAGHDSRQSHNGIAAGPATAQIVFSHDQQLVARKCRVESPRHHHAGVHHEGVFVRTLRCQEIQDAG